jgi:phosphoribosylanthranilate isomerase
MKGFIQIAGVRDLEEANRLVQAGVDALGFPFRLDHHREDLSETAAREIIVQLPSKVRPILITYLLRAEEILELAAYLGLGSVQLHGPIRLEEAVRLKKMAPDLWLIKSLVLRSDNEKALFGELRTWADLADAFLTDTYDPETGASGATGKTHDWEISKRLTEQSSKPLILAGGLKPQNVRKAIAKVRPWGVDVHSGVEDRGGWKDRSLVEEFVRETREAFAEI